MAVAREGLIDPAQFIATLKDVLPGNCNK